MKWGELKPSEYGIDQREVLNLMIEIEGEDRKLAPWLKFSRKELENYCKAFLSPTKRPAVSYSYGERLFRYTLPKVPKAWKKELGLTFDQIEHVIRRLKENWYTRRAIASTWKMEIDVMSKYPPCLTQLTWNIKNRKLYQTAIFRSQDIYGAWPLNAFALRKLQKRIAKELGLGIGSLIIISNSAHIYANSWSDCEKILKKWHKGKEFRFEPDRCGFFTIWIERGKIVVQHHLPDGRKSPYRFEGKDAVVLYRKILQENLLTRLDHAAYLGKELARAELALKRGKKFIQDST
jgi:thymidylate synthase